jgi:hypothetical protein
VQAAADRVVEIILQRLQSRHSTLPPQGSRIHFLVSFKSWESLDGAMIADMGAGEKRFYIFLHGIYPS